MPVKRASVDPKAAPLDPSRARQFGLVLSRFEFNGLPNPNYKAGRFSLKVPFLPVFAPPTSSSHPAFQLRSFHGKYDLHLILQADTVKVPNAHVYQAWMK